MRERSADDHQRHSGSFANGSRPAIAHKRAIRYARECEDRGEIAAFAGLAKDLSLTYEIDPSLPTVVFGDSVRFRQILMNLIANAIKFTSSGGVHIRLNHYAGNSRLCCEVVDTGNWSRGIGAR